MKKTTIMLPCEEGMEPFTGEVFGSFFVHKTLSDKEECPRGHWTVTHSATGLAVRKSVPSREKAINLARMLDSFNCWEFSTRAEAQQIPPDLLEQIHKVRYSV